MRISTVFAVAACLFTPALAWADGAACDPGGLAKKYPSLAGKTIRIATDGESPPYSFRDPADFDHLIGMDADLSRAVFACLGLTTEFKTGAWSGMLPSVIAGQADLMWDTLYYTPERAKQVNFVTYQLAATGGMVRKGNPKNIHSLDDICGLRAEAGLGTVEEARFRQVSEQTCVAANKPPVEVVTYQDMPSGLRLLQNNRTDLMMTDSGQVGQFIATMPNEFERAFTIKTDFQVGPGITKSLPELSEAVLAVMVAMQADGAQKKLMEKYHIDSTLEIPAKMLTK